MWRLRYWAFLQLAYPATLIPRCLFPYALEAWGGGDLVALADAAHVRAVDSAVVFAIRYVTTEDARARNTHDDVAMEPTMYGQLAIAMTTTVLRRHGALDGDDADNEPMSSLDNASAWALGCRVRSSCSHRVQTPYNHVTTA
jgi:hypothetical protein